VLKAAEGLFRAQALSTRLIHGDVSERPKVQLSKSCVRESAPWVQIPPSPPFFYKALENEPSFHSRFAANLLLSWVWNWNS
jgi:hypothetical protein